MYILVSKDCFTSDIDAEQQIFTTQYCSDSNIRKQLRRYPSTLYSVECSVLSSDGLQGFQLFSFLVLTVSSGIISVLVSRLMVSSRIRLALFMG